MTRRTTLGFLRVLLAPYRRSPPAAGVDAGIAPGPEDPRSAAEISFLQAGDGARRRTIEGKERETVSVLDFGAKGDGVTDDTAAFDAAIATGKSVRVPYRVPGYAVSGIKVVSNMQIVGEKSGMSLAPLLIVTAPDTSAFLNDSGDNVYHCTFENLACMAAIGVGGTSFYAQTTRTKYSGYFTFRNIETHKNLKTSYRGLFIFAVWDRCRDGYLGTGYGGEHSAIVALAGTYGQTNQQNVNRIKDSMFFGAFGGDAAIVCSFGVLWTIENTNFEALTSRAVAAYNILQLRFSNCWFEDITAPSIVHVGNYPGTGAPSIATFDHCNFVLTGTAPIVVSVDDPGTVSLSGNGFNVVAAGCRLCNSGDRIAINANNVVLSGAGAADLFTGMYHDNYAGGRRRINGAADNGIAGMTFQNDGGISATQGFLSRGHIRIGSTFSTIATSQTGLGGTCIVSGYDPDGGAQMRAIKNWNGAAVQDVTTVLNDTGKTLHFRVSGQDLQMRAEPGSIIAFTTMLH